MRRALPAVLAGVVLISSVTAIAAVRADRRPIKTKTVIHLQQEPVSQEWVFQDEQQGPRPGDYFVTADRLSQDGTRVGRLEALCTITSGGPQTLLCQAVIRVRSGQITLMGRLPASALMGERAIKVAVTGGTGAYRDVGGWARIQPDEGELTVTLLP